MSVPSLGILGLGQLQGTVVPHYAHGAMVVAAGIWVDSRKEGLGNGLRCRWHLRLGLGRQCLWHHRCRGHILYHSLGRAGWVWGSGVDLLLGSGPVYLGRNWSWGGGGVCAPTLNAFRFHYSIGMGDCTPRIPVYCGLQVCTGPSIYWRVGHWLTSLDSRRSCCGVGLQWHWETNILTTSRMYYRSSRGNRLHCRGLSQ